MITGADPSTAKDLAYLRILHLAAATGEAAVEAVLSTLLDARKVPDIETIRESLGTHQDHGHVPLMAALEVDLGAYDELLTAGAIS
jgi:hypothetical protein